MAITHYDVDSYRLYHLNVDNTYGQTAVINCYGGGSFRGALYFYKAGVTIPTSRKSPSGYLYLRYRDSQLAEVIDTLRKDQPLHIWLNDQNLWGGLATSSEPVGEEES